MKSLNFKILSTVAVAAILFACSDAETSDFSDPSTLTQTSNSNPTSDGFLLSSSYGGVWGGLIVDEGSTKDEIIVSGEISTAGGLSISNDPNLSYLNGKTLVLDISGSDDSEYQNSQVFRLTINDEVVYPENRDTNSDGYITPGDGAIFYEMPRSVSEFSLVFHRGDLNNLTIRAGIKDD